jgi:hypothetical protein
MGGPWRAAIFVMGWTAPLNAPVAYGEAGRD